MSRLVDVIFSVKDEFSKPLENFNIALEDVGRQGRQARKKIEDLGNDLSSFGAGLTAGVTVPLTGLATTSYSTFESVDKQLALVEATMGEANYATADLYSALGDAAVNSIFSMEEGASALVNYARQGWNAAEAADMLAPALNLAAGTATDLDSVTSGLGNTLKAFGASSDDAVKYVDMFTQAQAQANTDVTNLFEAMAIAGPMTRTVGWNFEDLATLIGVYGDNSISASEAAHALNTGLMRLASPAKAGATALEQLGINAFDANGKLLDMPDFIAELQKGFEGLSDQEALAAASSIFGKNQASKWKALIDVADVDALREMNDNIVSASGNAQAAADALVTPLERLKSTFDVFKTTVGEVLSDVFVPLIDKVTDLVDVFRQLEPSQRESIVRFAGIAAAAGPVLLAFGKIIAFVPQVMDFGAAVGKAGGLAKFGLAAISSPAGIVVAALAGVVAAGILVYKNWDTIKEKASAFSFAGDAVNNLLQRISPITTAIDEAFVTIGSAFQTAFSTIVGAFGDAAVSIAPHLEKFYGAFDSLLVTLSPIIESVGQLISDLAGGAGSQITTFGDVASAGIGLVATGIGGVLDAATGLIDFINVGFTGDWSAAWAAACDAFEPFEKVGEVVDSILTTLKNMITYLTGTFKSAWETTWTSVEAVFKPIGESISGIVDGISSAIETAGQGLANLKNAAAEKWDNSALNWKNWGGGDVAGNASGTSYWQGGPTRVNESGGEIINLPSGTQIIPHDASRNTAAGTGSVNIAKLADSIIIREDADIDRITDSLVRKLIKAQDNMGVVSPA